MITIDETLDKIMKLDFSSKEMLIEILQKRQTEDRIKEILKNGKQARLDFKLGKIAPSSAAQVISSLKKPL